MRLLSKQLHGVKPTDGLALLGNSVALMFVAIAGSSFPARREAKVDPTPALRYE
jgi:ABC-type lipoprotein release transport system permease subunit